MQYYRFLLGILFVWRITHLLNAEDGPWDVVVRLRRSAGEGFLGQMLDCFYCLSIWISAPLAILLGEKPGERILLFPALSAGAILLERITDNRRGAPQGPSAEYSEDNYGMLWKEEGAAPANNPV